MRRRREDNSPGLFDDPLKVVVESTPAELLAEKINFIADTKHTLGLLAKINKHIVTQASEGRLPNMQLAVFSSEITKSIKLAITSYNEIKQLAKDDDDITAPPVTIQVV